MRRFITLMVWAMVLIAIGFSSSTAKAADDLLYVFGQLAYSPSGYDNDHTKGYKLTLSKEENGQKTYKGTVAFFNGTNWFNIWGDNTKQGRKEGQPEKITIGTPVYADTSKDWSYGWDSGEGVYDIEVIRYNANDYGIKIVGKHTTPYPTKAYLYGNVNGTDSWSKGTSGMAEMTKIGDNDYEWEIQMTQSDMTYFRVCIEFSDNSVTYYAPYAADDLNDLSISLGNGYNSKIRVNKGDNGAFMGKLMDKYIQVEYNYVLGDPVYITVTDEPKYSTTDPNNIWIFGDLGNTQEKYGDEKWNIKETDYKLSKTDTENGKSVYTGKVTFRSGDNWFHFYGGAAESGPNTTNSNDDETITINTPFTTSKYYASAFKYNYTGADNKEYDVKLVYNGKQNYSVTISEPQTDESLYVYSTDNYGAPAVTLKKGADGHYKATLTGATAINSAFPGKRTYYLFVSDEKINGTEWNSFKGHLWTPEGNQDVKNGVAIPMAKEDNNAFVWNYKHDLTDLSFDVVLGTTPSFEMSTTFDDSANIYLFGDLGYTTTGWSDDKASQCILTETGTKKIDNVSYPVYTGKIKFKEGDNYFRIYGDNKELRPSTFDNGSNNYSVKLGTEFNANTEKGADDGYKSWKYTASKAVELDVELVKKNVADGVPDYVVTIMPYGGVTKLYVYDENNLQNPYATLTSAGDGIFSGNPTIDYNNQHRLFITDKEKTTEENMQSFKNRWTTTSKGDITLTNNNASTAISKNTTGGAMLWTLTDQKATKVTMTVNLKAGQFDIVTETDESSKYYLSGDMNDWVTDSDPNKLRIYQFMPVKNDDVNNEDGWYVLYIPRMHGQFKIHTGKWTDNSGTNLKNWGCDWTRTTGNDEYAEMNYTSNKAEIHDYIDNSVAAEKLGSDVDYNMTSGTNSYFNLRCAHNYYKDAYIYFNPDDNKLFIKGTPEDIYVYYYNGEDTNEAAGTATISIKEDAVNANTHHYYYDDRKLTANMESYSINDTRLNGEVLPDVITNNVQDGDKFYRVQVSPGLEEKNSADGTDHYFEFYIQNSLKLTSNDTEVFNGHNVYYIYTGTLPAVLFNYKDAKGNEVTSDTEGYEICYRLVAINESGVPEYIGKEDGTRTAKRSEAAKYTFNMTLTTSDGVTPESGKVGTKWLAVKKTTNSNSIMAKAAPAWASQVEPVKAGDVNRYVEFDVKLADPDDASKVYHEFHSDFELAADNDKDSYVQDGDIDLKAQMTGKLRSESKTNPQYKLNGTDLYAMAETSVPTAVEEIPVDNEYDNDANAETVYYNLQGVRVNNPDRGIYIMVKGKTSKKVRF